MYYFLLCNILTGCVNFTLDTVNTPPLQSVLVLVAYQAAAVTAISYDRIRWGVTGRGVGRTVVTVLGR